MIWTFLLFKAYQIIGKVSTAGGSFAFKYAGLKSCKLASEVYELYGKKGVVITDDEVKHDTPYHQGAIEYHRKIGEHGITKFDWNMFMDFADENLI